MTVSTIACRARSNRFGHGPGRRADTHPTRIERRDLVTHHLTTPTTVTLTLTLAARTGPGRPAIGRLIAPGLAVVADAADGTRWPRFSLVHIRSGKALCGPVTCRCAAHVEQAAVIVTGYGIDFDRPDTDLAPLLTATDMFAQLMDTLGLCFDPWTGRAKRCLGDRAGCRS